MRAELLNLPGMLEVKYHEDRDLFQVHFESVLLYLAAILAAVDSAGKKMGQDYVAEVIG